MYRSLYIYIFGRGTRYRDDRNAKTKMRDATSAPKPGWCVGCILTVREFGVAHAVWSSGAPEPLSVLNVLPATEGSKTPFCVRVRTVE